MSGLLDGTGLSAAPKTNDPDGAVFDYGLYLLTTRQYTEAFMVFDKLNKSHRHPACMFNLALCHLQAGEWRSAALLLEEAGALLSGKELSAIAPPEKKELIGKLSALEAQTEAYRQPMPLQTPESYGHMAKDKILRLLVDVYEGCGLWDKALNLGQKLEGKKYKNVMKAMELSKNKRQAAE